MADQTSTDPNTSRATRCARVSIGSEQPSSSTSRDKKLMPARLTTAFATTVATISRLSGCRRAASAHGSRSAVGK